MNSCRTSGSKHMNSSCTSDICTGKLSSNGRHAHDRCRVFASSNTTNLQEILLLPRLPRQRGRERTIFHLIVGELVLPRVSLIWFAQKVFTKYVANHIETRILGWAPFVGAGASFRSGESLYLICCPEVLPFRWVVLRHVLGRGRRFQGQQRTN